MSADVARRIADLQVAEAYYREQLALTRAAMGRLTSERDAWNDAAGDLTERLYQSATWSARWKAVATRYRAMLRTHRDRDIPRLAALEAENATLRSALLRTYTNRAGVLYFECLACRRTRPGWADHEPSCPLAAPPSELGARIVAVAEIARRLFENRHRSAEGFDAGDFGSADVIELSHALAAWRALGRRDGDG